MMIIRIIHSKRFITPVTFTYSYTDGRGVVQCLAQGHLDMQLGEPGIRTSDLPSCGRSNYESLLIETSHKIALTG